jgi:hypothetical protein
VPALAQIYVCTTIDDPLATNGQAVVYGISSNGVLSGRYFDATGSYAFIDDNGTVTAVDDPSYPGRATGGGLSDSNTVAGFDSAYGGRQQIGFVSSDGNLTYLAYLADPLAEPNYTVAEGVDDSATAVGICDAASDAGENGFIATEESVPEPAPIAMLTAGIAGITVARRRCQN